MLASSWMYSNDEKNQILSLTMGRPKRADIVLAREGLLGIGSRIVDRKARVEGSGAFVESFIAVPLIGAVLGGDDDRGGGGAAGIGVFLSGSNGKFLNGFRRKILEKAANPVIGIVDAIDGEIVVQAGAAAGRKQR